MAGIFISYRRDDAKHAAGRLVDRLVTAVGRDKLFMDVDNIEPGLDFVKVLNDQVGRADVLLALIGPGWLNARDVRGNRRLDNPADFVRIEIEAALARDIRVVPVLLDGAELPEPETLPDSLRPLLRRNAIRISHERFGAEADELAAAMRRALGLFKAGAAERGLFKTSAAQDDAAIQPKTAADTPFATLSGLGPTQSQVAAPSALGPKIAAALFALAGFPLAFAFAVWSAQGDWISATDQQQAFLGAGIGAVLICSTAVLAAAIRGVRLTVFEATSYAFGVASVCGFLVWFIVQGSKAGGDLGAELTGLAFATATTLAFHIWFKRRRAPK